VGYSLEVKTKHLILKRNGKQAEVYFKKYEADDIHNWIKRHAPKIKKEWIDQMLSAVGVKQEKRKRNDTRRIPRKARTVKKKQRV